MKIFETLESLKMKCDLVGYIEQYTNLSFSNNEYKGLCPFHQEKTPSFTIYNDKMAYKCFGCGKTGDIISAIMILENLSFAQTVKKLCDGMGVELKEVPSIIRQINKYSKTKEWTSKEHTYLLKNAMDEFPNDHNIKEWIEEGISYKILCKYDVRYNADKTQIVFPIFDEREDNRMVSIKTRTLLADFKERGIPKYTLLGKMGAKDFLYAWRNNLEEIKRKDEIIIVEAEKSVMKLETYGINNSVAVGSHFMSEDCERLILSEHIRDVVFAYDKDVSRSEIIRQTNILRHYTNCYYLFDDNNLIGEKDAPIDNGIEIWNYLYENKRVLGG